MKDKKMKRQFAFKFYFYQTYKMLQQQWSTCLPQCYQIANEKIHEITHGRYEYKINIA